MTFPIKDMGDICVYVCCLSFSNSSYIFLFFFVPLLFSSFQVPKKSFLRLIALFLLLCHFRSLCFMIIKNEHIHQWFWVVVCVKYQKTTASRREEKFQSINSETIQFVRCKMSSAVWREVCQKPSSLFTSAEKIVFIKIYTLAVRKLYRWKVASGPIKAILGDFLTKTSSTRL